MVGMVLSSSVIGVVASQLFQLWLKRIEVSKINKYAALNLCHELEAYAHGCMDVFSDNDLYIQSHGGAGRAASIPVFEINRDDFSKFEIALIDRLIALPKNIKSAKKEFEFITNVVGDEDEAEVFVLNRILRFGVDALDLSENLRSYYRLPSSVVKYGSTSLRVAIQSQKEYTA